MPALVQVDRICLSDTQVIALRTALILMLKHVVPSETTDAESQHLLAGYLLHASEILRMIDAR